MGSSAAHVHRRISAAIAKCVAGGNAGLRSALCSYEFAQATSLLMRVRTARRELPWGSRGSDPGFSCVDSDRMPARLMEIAAKIRQAHQCQIQCQIGGFRGSHGSPPHQSFPQLTDPPHLGPGFESLPFHHTFPSAFAYLRLPA